MKTPSQIDRCIACDSKDVHLESMGFMGEDAQFPICNSCEPYLQQVFADSSFGRDFMSFIGVTDIQRSNQSGGAFSCMISDSALPADFTERMQDFDLRCQYIGKRIQALRSG
jgi:hypothetical protein